MTRNLYHCECGRHGLEVDGDEDCVYIYFWNVLPQFKKLLWKRIMAYLGLRPKWDVVLGYADARTMANKILEITHDTED